MIIWTAFAFLICPLARNSGNSRHLPENPLFSRAFIHKDVFSYERSVTTSIMEAAAFSLCTPFHCCASSAMASIPLPAARSTSPAYRLRRRSFRQILHKTAQRAKHGVCAQHTGFLIKHFILKSGESILNVFTRFQYEVGRGPIRIWTLNNSERPSLLFLWL